MSDKLTIITTKEILESVNSNSDISIVPLREFSALNYKDGGGNWKRVTEGSRFRPIHLSELEQRLKKRGYNIGYRSFVDDKGGLRIDLNLESEYLSKPSTSSSPASTDNTLENALRIVEDFKEVSKYKEVLDNMDEREISLFDTSSQVVDIMSGVRTIDLINSNSDSYTNIISLVPLKRYNITEGVSCKVNLGIQYTSDGEIKYYSTIFSAFDYIEKDGNLVLESDNWMENVNDEVQIECINGILKALPISNNVTECIISNCTISYGYLKR